MNDRVTVTIEGGVADVRLVRVDKMNALDNAMFEALIETGDRLKADKAVRAVVISGVARPVAPGPDVGPCAQRPGGGGAQRRERPREGVGLASRTHGISNRAQYAV